MWPHRRQPTSLPRPWDSPGKNTGVGCHFLLQRMKVKSESEVAQSCLTLSDPMDCSPPGSPVHGIFQARVPGSPVHGIFQARVLGKFQTYAEGVVKLYHFLIVRNCVGGAPDYHYESFIYSSLIYLSIIHLSVHHFFLPSFIHPSIHPPTYSPIHLSFSIALKCSMI